MRTTLDIDESVLRELKALQKREKRSLGELASRLLAHALAAQKQEAKPRPKPKWNTHEMGAGFDLQDKDALYAILDGGGE